MHDHGDANHSHGARTDLPHDSFAILERGIGELLRMTQRLDLRPLPSEKHPFPLASAVYLTPPRAERVRADAEARMHTDPVGALENVLALLELYECNQPDMADHFLEDLKFLGTCFSSKRCNGWIAAMGDGDRDGLEKAVNARWQFKFFSGPPRPTGVYVLLSMLARYAYVYGRVKFGDSHELGHFVEGYCPGLIVCCGRMTDLELTLSLAAMKMGVPAIVPEDYPFPLGRTIRTSRLEEIVEAVVGFPNIRRLLSVPGIPQLPPYCDPENAKQEIVPAVTWGGTAESFVIVRKGAVPSPGYRVIGSPGSDLGVTVTIDAEPMDAFDRAFIERSIVP
jgi:hypothetical protein